MKIVLLKEVQGIGYAGDIKEVKDGYARNFLIPQGLADILTKYNLSVLEAQKRKKERSKKLGVRSKKLLASKIKGKSFEIKVNADEKGSLYAGLDAKAIAAELAKQKFVVEASEVILDKAIKKVGEYEVELRLEGEKVKIKLEVRSNLKFEIRPPCREAGNS